MVSFFVPHHSLFLFFFPLKPKQTSLYSPSINASLTEPSVFCFYNILLHNTDEEM